jgi:hypothetical protein|eukprot:COSAG02_NODE_182_length_30594_cov_23.562912_13_plen_292_part_00
MGRKTAQRRAGHAASSSPEALLPRAAAALLSLALALVLMQVPRDPRSGARTTTAAASREHAAYVLGDSKSVRSAQARVLLQALVEDGALLHTPVQLAEHATTGLGIFAAQKLVRGQPIFTLPARHLIRPVADGIGAAAVLVQEQRQASSKAMELFIASLPRECPANIAARSRTASDLALVSLSLHAWKTELLRAELSFLGSAMPSDYAATASEAEWATCMLMSRAFGVDDDPQTNKAAGHGMVMVPFVDLLKCASELIASACPAKGLDPNLPTAHASRLIWLFVSLFLQPR